MLNLEALCALPAGSLLGSCRARKRTSNSMIPVHRTARMQQATLRVLNSALVVRGTGAGSDLAPCYASDALALVENSAVQVQQVVLRLHANLTHLLFNARGSASFHASPQHLLLQVFFQLRMGFGMERCWVKPGIADSRLSMARQFGRDKMMMIYFAPGLLVLVGSMRVGPTFANMFKASQHTHTHLWVSIQGGRGLVS